MITEADLAVIRSLLDAEPGARRVGAAGLVVELEVEAAGAGAPFPGTVIRAPAPGRLAIAAASGSRVAAGEALGGISLDGMSQVVRAPAGCVVERWLQPDGAFVEHDALLCLVRPAHAAASTPGA